MKIINSKGLNKVIRAVVGLSVILTIVYATKSSYDIQMLRVAGENAKADALVLQFIGIALLEFAAGAYLLYHQDKAAKAAAQAKRKNPIEHTEYDYNRFLKTKR